MNRLGLRIGIVFEGFDSYPRRSGDASDHAVEYEPESTIEGLEGAIRELRHEPVRIGTPHHLLDRIARRSLPGLDAALNIAEAYGSRNREAWAPVLLEMAGIPTLGSDALTLSLTLDKAWTNRAVAAAGIRVAPQVVLDSLAAVRSAKLPADFPLFVKPRWEGTSKGIGAMSRVEDLPALEHEVERVVSSYRQPALVESFLAGAEYTVTIVGNAPPRALPVLQRALHAETRIGLHAVEGVHDELRAGRASDSESAEPPEPAYALPGQLDAALEAELQGLALRVYQLFECRDFARADFRLDRDGGEPVFLEINPLPTFAADGSFGILAELEGRSLEALLAEVLAEGLSRLGLS
jgi:D-alanine-D-alanine ligase